MGTEPDDGDGNAVHNQVHEGHHGRHGTACKQLSIPQSGIGTVKALFLVALTSKCTNDRQTGEDFAGHKVHIVHQGLHLLELGHSHQQQNHQQQEQASHRSRHDPAQARIRSNDLGHAADAHNGRVQHHAQQQYTGHLHLHNVIGASGDERRGRQVLQLGVREAHHLGKHITAQVTTDGRAHAGGNQPQCDARCRRSQSNQPHFAAHGPQIVHLHLTVGKPRSHLCHIHGVRIRNAAANQTDVHNIAHEPGQLQLAQCLHQQQTDDSRRSLPMGPEQFDDFQHIEFPFKKGLNNIL